MPTTQYNLHLKGFVGGYDFDRDYVDYVLAKHEGSPVNVLIDSLGGSLATALSIASAFRNHGDVTVHFVGMNASAATIASLGAKHISIDASAMYLVHQCSMSVFEWDSLNSTQFEQLIAKYQQTKADLDKLDLNVASMYASKCKKDKQALLDLMKVGGWLTAQDALEWGFVDEITNCAEDDAPKLTDELASAMASAGLPIPNVPIETLEKESAIAKFFSSLSSIFNSKHKSEMPNQTNSETAPASAQPIEASTASASTESVDEVAALKVQIAERDKTIAELQARIAAAPADTTTAVVDSSPSNADDSHSYAVVVKGAHDMFNAIP
jgi:ATP-dependent protease ClpP protease subunit